MATIGTKGDDVLTGTAGNDSITGLAGNDQIDGDAGDDVLSGGEGDDVLVGGDGNDTLDGGTGADRMEGGAGADTYYVDDESDVVVESQGLNIPTLSRIASVREGLMPGDTVISRISFALPADVENLELSSVAGPIDGDGNSLANTLLGNSSNNLFRGFGGDDFIDARDGLDVVAYAAPFGTFEVTKLSSGYSVFSDSGVDGRDTLINVERLRFSDTMLAIDLDGHAGQTAKLLGAVFGVAAVSNKQYVGIGLSLLDGGMSYEQLASLAMGAAGKTIHADVVALLWTNLFGVAPTASQAAPVLALLDGGLSVGALTVLAADFVVNTDHINLVGLAQTGLEYSL